MEENRGFLAAKAKLDQANRISRDAKKQRAASFYKKCRLCTNSITYDNRKNDFCSRACSATFFNKSRRNSTDKVNTSEVRCKTCTLCGSKTLKPRYKWCSKNCEEEWKYRTYIKEWLEGVREGGNEFKISRYVKRWFLEQHNNKCSLCGWTGRNIKTGNIPLQVDHIDGNSRNNARSNLRLICPNCHSLTATYGALNRGNGRRYRYLKHSSRVS